MRLFKELLMTDVGLLSFLVIVFMLGMGVFFIWLFTQKAAASRKSGSSSGASSRSASSSSRSS